MNDVQGDIGLQCCLCGATVGWSIPTGWEIGILEVEWVICPECRTT